MNDYKKLAREKIARFQGYIQALTAEKKALNDLIEGNKLNELDTAKALQRIFVIETTIDGHENFKRHYEARLNPTTYKKRIE